jgi:HD-like signal output (HDOD) protein
VVIKDQALVARLLKVANSGCFGSHRHVDTIPEAVVLVGLDNMKNMVYAANWGGMLRQDLRCYRYPGKGLWRHAMGVGIVARALSEMSRHSVFKGEEAFASLLLKVRQKLANLEDFYGEE